MSSYYECKRCFYKCYQKGDMLKHLNVKILCDRIVESFNYCDNELKDISLRRIYPNKIDDSKNKCSECGKCFSYAKTLNKHQNNCKYKKIIKNNEKIKNTDLPIPININDNSIDNSIVNSIDNSVDNSIHIKNINLNIQLINSFDEQWNITHIDDNKKLILLLNNTKFTSTLEKILENEVNLNVLIDETSDKGLVYNEKKITNIDIKEIVKKTMDKLFNHLRNFKNDILEPNKYNIDKTIIEEQIKLAETKYNDYKTNKDDIEGTVDTIIKDIYTKKKDDTLSNYNEIVKKGY